MKETKESKVKIEYQPKFVIFEEAFFDNEKASKLDSAGNEIRILADEKLSKSIHESFTVEDIRYVIKKLLKYDSYKVYSISGNRRQVDLDEAAYIEEYKKYMSKRIVI